MDVAETLRQATPGRTTRAGGWNGRTLDLPVPVGRVSATMSDGGNCFNLNSVVEPDQQDRSQFKSRPRGIEQFARLLVTQQVPSGDARDIAHSLADWIDSDQSVSRGGAEDSHYRALDIPYYSSGELLRDVSELRLVKGVTAEIYANVSPFICALPEAELSPVNVNTLRPENAVLLAILGTQAPDLNAIAGFLGNIPDTGYASTTDFWAQRVPASLQAPRDAQQQVKLVTRFFRLDIVVETPSALVEETALIDADRAPARLVSRSWTSGL